ncbi:DUF4345 domain-containing protein [Lutimaribacter saemankumensis]|uniref:DUF4345 domain-containing protein n=1 Tax=Lutimaribacter saemankumensis TaxID=490829 RepID=A0A1G8GBK0_9RHOB|nr:DUF4345 domain-containing protein [Lutimaribacter saemankumensis]SDH91723.1 protein of unknown function [Lutimaribacter saemankumensis]
MSLTTLEKIALGISGLTAFGIGAAILAAPHAFYASYGITLDGNASLLSELRAPAAGLAAFGLLMLMGILRPAMAAVSKAASLTVFLAFPAGRLIGLAIEGLPSTGILAALVLELGVAMLCLVAFKRRVGRSQLAAARSKS